MAMKDKTSILTTRNIDDNVFPYLAFSLDLFVFISWALFWIIRCHCCNADRKKYFSQAVLSVGPIFLLVTHLPYIVISYLNDASYASSIFIYYIVVSFVIFGSIDTAIRAFQQTTKKSEFTTQLIINNSSGESHESGSQNPSHRNNERFSLNWGAKIVTVLFVPFVLILIGMTTAALVVIPISRAFSDAPNRLLGFYETVIVIAGAYVAYKGIFGKKMTLEAAIRKRIHDIRRQGDDSEWQKLSEDEKVAQFYDYLGDIVADYKTNGPELNITDEASSSGDDHRGVDKGHDTEDDETNGRDGVAKGRADDEKKPLIKSNSY